MDLKDIILASHFASGAGGGGSGDLSNYYTKAQSNARYGLKTDLEDKQNKILVVNIERIGGAGGGSYTADKTNAEIYAAWQAGREIIAEVSRSKMRCVVAMANVAYFSSIIEDETALLSIEDDVVTFTNFKLQPKTIADTAGYYTTDTVEGALAEIGAELTGINTLVGSGVIV